MQRLICLFVFFRGVMRLRFYFLYRVVLQFLNRAFYVIFLRHQVGRPSSLIEYVSIASPRWMLKMRLLCGLFNGFSQPYHKQVYPAGKITAMGIMQRHRQWSGAILR